jgi:hypothetical protein
MMTAVMLWINHSTIYWFDEGRLSNLDEAAINNILNALQLLAKIYEIAVLASLAHISIKVFKRRLVGKGLPAGMVTAGYRVGDLFYLASPQFWSGRKGAALFVIFLFVNTILTVLMGPASAILIVPKLGRFRVRAPFFPGAVPVFMDTPDLHWPDLLDDGVVANITECAQEPANYQDWMSRVGLWRPLHLGVWLGNGRPVRPRSFPRPFRQDHSTAPKAQRRRRDVCDHTHVCCRIHRRPAPDHDCRSVNWSHQSHR